MVPRHDETVENRYVVTVHEGVVQVGVRVLLDTRERHTPGAIPDDAIPQFVSRRVRAERLPVEVLGVRAYPIEAEQMGARHSEER